MHVCSFSRTQHLFPLFKIFVEVYSYCIFTLCPGFGYICDYSAAPQGKLLVFKDDALQGWLHLVRTTVR